MEGKILVPNGIGGNIAAVVHRPESPTDKLAILTPGYLDTKDYPHLVHLADSLTKRGYTAVRYDPTGIWESQGDIQDYTIDRQLKDMRAILDSLLKERTYSQTLLGGHSRGGLISILYAETDPRVTGVLAVMSPYMVISTVRQDKIKEWKKSGFRISQRNIPGSTEKKEFRVPYADIESSQKHNALETVKNLHIPIFFVTGELDNVVPPQDVKLTYDSANDPKYFLTLQGIGHDYRHNPDEIEKVDSQINQLLESAGF